VGCQHSFANFTAGGADAHVLLRNAIHLFCRGKSTQLSFFKFGDGILNCSVPCTPPTLHAILKPFPGVIASRGYLFHFASDGDNLLFQGLYLLAIFDTRIGCRTSGLRRQFG